MVVVVVAVVVAVVMAAVVLVLVVVVVVVLVVVVCSGGDGRGSDAIEYCNIATGIPRYCSFAIYFPDNKQIMSPQFKGPPCSDFVSGGHVQGCQSCWC